MRRCATALFTIALAAAPGLARAQPPGAPEPEEEEEEGPRPAPFLAASIGGGALSDAEPGLTGGVVGVRGHLELGYGDGRFVSGALSVALGRTNYDNTIPPPESVQPESSLHVNRVGFGAVGEGRLPLGRVVPVLGAGAYLDRLSAKARGSALGIHVNYFDDSDVALGFEARAGVDVRVHPAVELGARAGWYWSRADFDDLTGGAAWMSGPWIELRVSFDASGFRMAPPSSRRR
jgi:hypothetical protein